MIVQYGIIIIIKTLYNISCLASYKNAGNFTVYNMCCLVSYKNAENFTVYNICPMSTKMRETSLSSCLMS